MIILLDISCMDDNKRYTELEDILSSENTKKRFHNENNNVESNINKKTKTDVTIDEFLDEIFQNNPKKKNTKWTKNIDDSEVEKYVSQLDKIKQGVKDKLVSEANILKSNLPFNEKVKLMELLNILRNTPNHTYEKYELKNLIRNKIKEDTCLTNDDINLEIELNGLMDTEVSLKGKILKCSHPLNVKKILYKRYIHIADMKEDNEEYVKAKNWIESVLSLPTAVKPIFSSNNPEELSSKLIKIKRIMSENIYGQSKAKERILDIISSMFINSTDHRSCFAMVGEPGVGKTVFAKCLAKALDLPFYQISMGGIKDSHNIMGHSETYIGSKYGEIVRSLVTMKQKNGILLLDEFDKIKSLGSDVSNAFLHIFDYSQNKEFKDEYMPEIPIDLSNLLIIVSVNDIKKVDYIVADRLPLVYFKDYSFHDKVKIGLNYFVPRIESMLKFAPNDILITKSIMKYIIRKSTYSDVPGVRQLERNLLRIYEKLNTLKLTKHIHSPKLDLTYELKNFSIPYTLSKKSIDILFDEDDGSDDKDEKIYK